MANDNMVVIDNDFKQFDDARYRSLVSVMGKERAEAIIKEDFEDEVIPTEVQEFLDSLDATLDDTTEEETTTEEES